MARFYPNAQSVSVPQSERRVFEALKKLSDDWLVVHGLRFVTPARGKRSPRNGEADFVLIHPRYGLIVLEAKGGRYEVERTATGIHFLKASASGWVGARSPKRRRTGTTSRILSTSRPA